MQGKSAEIYTSQFFGAFCWALPTVDCAASVLTHSITPRETHLYSVVKKIVDFNFTLHSKLCGIRRELLSFGLKCIEKFH
jgi:hypothetical protein